MIMVSRTAAISNLGIRRAGSSWHYFGQLRRSYMVI